MKMITTTTEMELKEAEENIITFLNLQTQKAAIDASMKGYKEKLKTFADNNPELVDENGNLHLGAGYLRYGKKTVVKNSRSFKLVDFVKKFPALLKWELKSAPIKEMFKDDDTKKQMRAFGISMTEVPKFDIIAAKSPIKTGIEA